MSRKNILTIGIGIIFLAALHMPSKVCAGAPAEKPATDKPLRVLVLTGGHGFETEPFYTMFGTFKNMQIDHAEMDETCSNFDDISDWNYQVIVFYNFKRKLTEQGQQNLMKLCEKGLGIVVLHHALAGFDEWPEWRKIAGAKYFLEDTEEDGVLYKRCTYQHDVVFDIRVEKEKPHAICQGVNDFQIHDETYKGYRLEPNNTILLTTDEPLSQKEVGWIRTYKNARVFSLALGHDHYAYENPAYRKLVTQGILWAANKLPCCASGTDGNATQR